jgi:hypothetical protein
LTRSERNAAALASRQKERELAQQKNLMRKVQRWRAEFGWTIQDCADELLISKKRLLRDAAAVSVTLEPDKEEPVVQRRCAHCGGWMLGTRFQRRCSREACEGAGIAATEAGRPLNYCRPAEHR